MQEKNKGQNVCWVNDRHIHLYLFVTLCSNVCYFSSKLSLYIEKTGTKDDIQKSIEIQTVVVICDGSMQTSYTFIL